MAYHSGCGGKQFGDQRPHIFNSPIKWTKFDKILLTILNVLRILILEQLFGIVYHERGLGLYDKE
jgi:hypothetical protein